MSRDQDRANAFLDRLVKAIRKPTRQEQVRGAALKRKKEWFGEGAREGTVTDREFSAPHEPASIGSRLASLQVNENRRASNERHHPASHALISNDRPLARFGHNRGWGYLVHNTEIDEQLEHIPQHRRDALARDYSAGPVPAPEALAAVHGVSRRNVMDKKVAARKARRGT